MSVLVNNAGIALPADFLEVSHADFQKVLNVNLTGSFLATQRAAKSMIAAGIEGAIVNMSSVNAQVAIPSIAAYCASKGGIMPADESRRLGFGATQYSRQRRRTRFDRHQYDSSVSCQPRSNSDGNVAHST